MQEIDDSSTTFECAAIQRAGTEMRCRARFQASKPWIAGRMRLCT